MWSVEREPEATQSVSHGHGEDRLHEATRKVIAPGSFLVNVIWPMRLCRLQQRIPWVECLCCMVPCLIGGCSPENLVLLTKDTG